MSFNRYILREAIDATKQKDYEVAARLGLTKGALSNLIHGRRSPSLRTVERIIRELQIPAAKLFSADE